ncbi:melanoma cell adhesion molecule b isoform X2 [Heterodontus francisci]|uniref:melanoma cell adhesion molecule b isoform X2 n=1 Tax=Heterodontus francisci TaxID=7792 RepID=UPI00355C7D4E
MKTSLWIVAGQGTTLRYTAELLTSGIIGTVQVSTPPVVEAEIGKPINIPCVPEISTPSTMKYVQWFVMEKNTRQRIYFQDGESSTVDNGTDYTGRIRVNKNYTLTIDHVKLGDERTFLCQVGAGPAGSGEATTELKVYGAPEVPEIIPTEARVSVMKINPSDIALCRTRNGYPAPNITWYKDHTPLQATTKINHKMYVMSKATQEPNGLYTIESTLYYLPEKKDKDSKFYCEVSYRMPSGVDKMKESDRFSIPVTYPTENVEFLIQPSVLKEADNMTMECKSDGSSPVEYTFYRVRDGKEEEDLESNGNTIEINGVKRMDSGIYGCRVLDLEVEDKYFDSNKTIIINYLDPIGLKPKGPYIFTDGDRDVNVSCDAKGSQQTSVVWTKHKKTVVSFMNVLRLPVVTFDDSGNYICKVTVPSIPNLTRQKSISIVVKGPPEVNCTEKKFSKNGPHFNLTCMFKGNPAPEVTCNVKQAPTIRYHQNNYIVVSELIVPLTEERLNLMCNGANVYGSTTHNLTVYRGSMTVSTRGPPTADVSHGRSSGGVVIVVIIVCILLLAILGAVLYFLYKKGKIPCGRSGKQDITQTDAHDDIVVEVKNDQKVPEETVLLQGVNGEKKPPSDQGEEGICRPSE